MAGSVCKENIFFVAAVEILLSCGAEVELINRKIIFLLMYSHECSSDETLFVSSRVMII